MKKITGVWMVTAVAGVCFISAGAKPLHAASEGTAMPLTYMQDRGWEEPPQELDEVSRKGFRDGVEGAHKDYDNHRRPDVNNREEFRHPHVPERDREAYRHGYERGYQVGVDHLYRGR